MQKYIYCCPVCGGKLTYNDTYCKECKYSKLLDNNKNIEVHKQYNKEQIANRPVALYVSNYPLEYYEYLSEEKYGSNSYWEEIFISQELSKNRLFDQVKYKQRIEKSKKKNEQTNKSNQQDDNNEQVKCVPKCPTCGSTNVCKIPEFDRAVYGLAFGLFSKTARSQFECRNCGYKF